VAIWISVCWSNQWRFGSEGAAGLAGLVGAMILGLGAAVLVGSGAPLALAARSRRALSSHSGQMSCLALVDLKLFPH
jgi:hypothetical protein